MGKSKKEKFARFGIATKGIVYSLLGILIIMSVLGLGGEKAGLTGMFQFLEKGVLGKAVLLLIASGMCGYVFWRLYQTFIDRTENGFDLMGIMNRLSYFSTAVFYGVLGFTAVKILVFSKSGSKKALEDLVSTLLNKPKGQILVCILAVIFLGNALFQFYIAFSGIFKKDIHVDGISGKQQKILLRMGLIGFIARGITIGAISYLLFKAAYTTNSNDAGGTKDAFYFLQDLFGSVALIALASGLLAFGLFLLIKAYYRTIRVDEP